MRSLIQSLNAENEMSKDFWEVTTLIFSIIIPLASIWLGITLSSKKFITERYIEKEYEAYSNSIQAIYSFVIFLSELLSFKTIFKPKGSNFEQITNYLKLSSELHTVFLKGRKYYSEAVKIKLELYRTIDFKGADWDNLEKLQLLHTESNKLYLDLLDLSEKDCKY